MSGTWRSRHWRQDESKPASVAAASGSNRVEHRTNSTLGNDRNVDRREKLSHASTSGESSRDDADHKEWRRGQRLPSPPPDTNRGKDRRDQPNTQSVDADKSKPEKGERKRATFSAAPTNAWGKPVKTVKAVSNEQVSAAIEHGANNKQTATASQPTSVSAIASGAVKLTKETSLVQSEPSASNQSMQNKQLKPARSTSNPWNKQETAAPKTPNENVFPSLDNNLTKAKSSANSASGKFESKAIAPLSLPTTSLWGKSQNRATSEKSKEAKSNSSKVEDFPSLSTASSAPKSIQQHSPTTPTLSTLATKEKGVKNKAPSLASFLLPPQLSGEKKKISTSSRSKHNASSKTVTAVKKTTAGVKRSVTSPMRVTEDKVQTFHPSIINPVDGPALKKGRQRVTPKKKKLTTLKKRVLEERLRIWKEKNDQASPSGKEAGDIKGSHEHEDALTQPHGQAKTLSSTILIENFVRPDEDDLSDQDEYEEIVSNLLSLAGRVGRVTSVFVPRPIANDAGDHDKDGSASIESSFVGSSFVRFSSDKDAIAGLNILHGVVVGGQKLHVSILNLVGCECADDDHDWQLAVLRSMSKQSNSNTCKLSEHKNLEQNMEIDHTSRNIITFHNILTDDDYEDSDALAESVEDISSLARQYGQVVNAQAAIDGLDKGNVYVSFADDSIGVKAAQRMNGMIIGGSQILVTTQLKSPYFKEQPGAFEVLLENVLNENDFEDDDCLNESIEDISHIARRLGVIGRVYADTTGGHKGRVHIEFLEGEKAAQDAAGKLDGMLIGGSVVSANATCTNVPSKTNAGDKVNSEIQQGPPPIYSGDKMIPERFAACKRVPKIPNAGPRSYAVKINDERAVPLLIEMLGELMRLQERSKDDKNARARRRLVMGLREVARGIRAHKVKMVVMANNLDEYGAIDAKLQEILEIARAEDVPVVFEFNKRKLGKAIGKSIKVSVVGIQSADGAQEQFKKLRKILGVV